MGLFHMETVLNPARLKTFVLLLPELASNHQHRLLVTKVYSAQIEIVEMIHFCYSVERCCILVLLNKMK